MSSLQLVANHSVFQSPRKALNFVIAPWSECQLGAIIKHAVKYFRTAIGKPVNFEFNGRLDSITFSRVNDRHYGLVRYAVYQRHNLHLHDVRRGPDRLGFGSGIFCGRSFRLGVCNHGNHPFISTLISLLRTRIPYCEYCQI